MAAAGTLTDRWTRAPRGERGGLALPQVPAPPITESTLAAQSPGAVVRVIGVDAQDSPATARRLADLGFTPGTTVEVLRRAPLGDPVVYRVRDYEICLRGAQASRVRTTGLR